MSVSHRLLVMSVLAFGLFGGSALAYAGSLQEALEQTYLSNPTLAAERARLRQLDEGVPEALSGWRPTAIATVQGGYANRNTRQSFPTINRTPREVETTPQSYGVTVTQPIFRGFRTEAGTEAAEKRVFAGRDQLVATEQNVLLQAVTAYMNVYRDEVILEINRQNVIAFEQQLTAAQARFDVGQTTRTDIAEAQSRLAQGISDRIQADGNLIASRAIYQQVIGNQADQMHEPAADTNKNLPASLVEAAEAASARPELLAAKKEAEAAKEDIRVSFGEVLPEIALEGSFTRSEDVRGNGITEDDATVLGTLRVPLYQAGGPDARIRQAKQRYSELLERINEQQRLSRQLAIDAWRLWETAKGQIKSSEQQVAAAELALEGVIAEQEAGLRTVLDIYDQQRELRDAKVNLIQAKTSSVVAEYQILQAIGNLTARKLALNVPYYDETVHYNQVRNKFLGWDTE